MAVAAAVGARPAQWPCPPEKWRSWSRGRGERTEEAVGLLVAGVDRAAEVGDLARVDASEEVFDLLVVVLPGGRKEVFFLLFFVRSRIHFVGCLE